MKRLIFAGLVLLGSLAVSHFSAPAANACQVCPGGCYPIIYCHCRCPNQ